MTAIPPNPDKLGVARHLTAGVLPILKYPNPKLHQECEDVTMDEFESDELGQLVMDMCLTMDSNDGVGLAAPQVGVLKNIIVTGVHVATTEINRSGSPTGITEHVNPVTQHNVLINPEIIDHGGYDMIFRMDEGCLSVPGYFERRHRQHYVTVRYQSPRGDQRINTFEQMESFVVQHEMDHLNGILFVDNLSKLKKDRIKKKIKRYTPTPELIFDTPL